MKLKIQNIFFVLGLCLLTFLFFQPILTLSFFWDDHSLILYNKNLEDWRNIFYVFHDQTIMTGSLVTLETDVYRPLRTLYFVLIVSLFGKEPLLFFGFNLLLHCLNTFLFKKALDTFFPEKSRFLKNAFAWVFLFHPIHLESINTAFGSADLFGTCFFLYALLLAIRDPFPFPWKRMIGIGSLCYLAMLSKEMFITTPWICMLGMLYKSRLSVPKEKSAGLEKTFDSKSGPRQIVFLGLLSLVYLIQRSSITGAFAQTSLDFSIQEHFLYVFQTIAAYCILFFCPVHLSQIYLAPDQDPWMFLLLPFLSAALIGLILITWEKKQGACLWLLAFLIALFPIANVLPIETFINDRLFYFPSLILLFFLLEITPKQFSLRTAGLVIFLLSIYFYLGFQRNREWQDPITIWKKTYEDTLSAKAFWNITRTLYHRERYSEITQLLKDNPTLLPKNSGKNFKENEHKRNPETFNPNCVFCIADVFGPQH
jgi:hypothetical protein